MNRKQKITAVIGLCLIAASVWLLQTGKVFVGHHASATAVFTELLQKTEQRLPGHETDLTMALGNPAATADWQEVTDWQVTAVSLANTQSLVASLRDDDPVVRLSLDVWVRWQNGRQATLIWQSWRYGLALGPLVINGDGPPGAIVTVTDNCNLRLPFP